MKRWLLLGLVLLFPLLAYGQAGGPFIRQNCAALTSPTSGATWCFDTTTRTLRVYDGSGFIHVTGLAAGPYKIGTGDATVPDGQNAFGWVYNGNLAGIANGNAWGLLSATNFTRAASGFHPYVSGSELDFPHIFGPGASIGHIAAVRIGADGAAPYSSAQHVYALLVMNGIAQFQGGDNSSVTRPAVGINNHQTLTWRDASDGVTNAGFLFLDSSNVLNIGAGNQTRMQIDSSGVFSFTGNPLTNVQGLSTSSTLSRNLTGTCTFSGGTTCAVSFGTAEPDALYKVVLGCGANKTFWWSAKATTGFTINASSSSSDTCDWMLAR